MDFSGDYGIENFEDGEEYDDYDYNGDYNYEDYIYEEGGNVLNLDYEPISQPETRVIPSLATPTFPEPFATLASAAPAPGGHSRVHPDPSLHFSPVFISTPVYVSVWGFF